MNEYFIRITPYDTSDLSDIRTVFEDIGLDTYVLSRESASRVHYHSYIRTRFTAERLRYQLKSRIGGQIYISGKSVEDKIRAIAYTIKDGDYVYGNIDVNELLMAIQQSKPKVTFDDTINAITSDTVDSVTKGVVRAYKEFKRKPHLGHMEALVRYILLKNSSSYEQILINKIIDRV